MKPILRAVQYFAEQNECRFETNSLLSFLRDEISFPRFLSLTFHINYSDFDISKEEVNNSSAFKLILTKFYFEQFSFWDSLKTEIGDEMTYIVFLSLVLVEQCFEVNIKSIYNKSHLITGIDVFKYDLFNIEFLLKLLNKLTDGRVPIKVESDDLDGILIQSFEKAKVPLIIDKSCFEIQYKFLFLIQIQIIFETFHNKCSKLIHDSAKANYYCDVKFDLIDDKLIILNSLKEIKSNLKIETSFDFGCFTKDNNNYHNSELEEMIDQSVLDTINNIINDFDIVSFNIFNRYKVPTLVFTLLKDDQSAHDFIKKLIAEKKLLPSIRVLELINFLKNKYPRFKILLIDFTSEHLTKSSIINLSTAILDSFFLKKSKEELYDRLYTLLYGKFKKKDSNYQPYENVQGILYNFNTYVTLIHFICDKDAKITYNSSKKFQEAVLKNNNKVPMVISEDFLKVCPQEYIPSVIYYQLQFIFNALDASDLSHHIVEYFLITIRKLTEIAIPPSVKLVKSIRSKNISLIFQNKRYEQNLEKKNSVTAIKQNDNQIVDKNIKNQASKHKKSKDKVSNLDTNNLNQQYKKNYLFENGILFNKNFENGSQIFQDLMKYAKEYDEIKDGKVPIFSNIESTISNDYPLFNLLFYIKNEGWRVNIRDINLIIKMSNKKSFKISLVFLFESDIEKIQNIIKNINYRTTDDIIDNYISIFGFFDKSISDLIIDDNSRIPKIDKKTIPLYMFLYVPEDKPNLPNIEEIVFNIYFFLSLISDINIVILDREKCIEQTKVINRIVNLKKYYDENIQNKDKIESFLSNCKLIFQILVNDDSICLHKANEDIENASLFKDIPCKICFINVNDQKSYGDFFNNFLQFAIESNNDPDDILSKFKYIKEFKMNYNDDNINCVLDNLEPNPKKELKKRSRKNLKYLSQILKNRLYWSNEQLDNIRYGHIDFLKDEFFNIIQELYSKDDISLIYEANESILHSQIDKDTIKIDKIFQEVEKRREICQTTREIDAEKGTNYTTRETENEREIKARIESTGKLEDLIEQDF